MLEQEKSRKIIYGVLIALGVYMLIKAGERADLISSLVTGWFK